jgi:hypothetical protein
MRMRVRATRVLVATLALTGLLSATAVGASAAESSTWHRKAKLTLVHGIPGQEGLPVDITLRKAGGAAQRFEDVTFGTIAGPLQVSKGLYRVAIRPADAAWSSKPILSKWIHLWGGSNRAVVAHLSEGGSPRLSVYTNDVRPTWGKARVTVRHDAAAPKVDVYAGTSPVIEDLRNPYQRSIVVPAGTYPISVAPANTSYAQRVFGPADLHFAKNTLTIVYAVGSLSGGTFTPLVQVLPLG